MPFFPCASWLPYSQAVERGNVSFSSTVRDKKRVLWTLNFRLPLNVILDLVLCTRRPLKAINDATCTEHSWVSTASGQEKKNSGDEI